MRFISRETLSSKDSHHSSVPKANFGEELCVDVRDKLTKHGKSHRYVPHSTSAIKVSPDRWPLSPQTNCRDRNQVGLVSIIPVVEPTDLKPTSNGLAYINGFYTKMKNMTMGTTLVTVRSLKRNSPPSNLLIQECIYMRQLRHPGLLILLAICRSPNNSPNIKTELSLVYENISYGSLYHCLHKSHMVFSETAIFNFLRQICNALDYIHQHGLVHGNVTSHAVQIMNTHSVKLGNFEHMHLKEKSKRISFNSSLSQDDSWRWMAPETLLEDLSFPESDVFSFCCIAFESLVRRLPWNKHSQKFVKKHYKANKTFPLEMHLIPTDILQYLENGFSIDRYQRSLNFPQLKSINSLKIHNHQDVTNSNLLTKQSKVLAWLSELSEVEQECEVSFQESINDTKDLAKETISEITNFEKCIQTSNPQKYSSVSSSETNNDRKYSNNSFSENQTESIPVKSLIQYFECQSSSSTNSKPCCPLIPTISKIRTTVNTDLPSSDTSSPIIATSKNNLVSKKLLFTKNRDDFCSKHGPQAKSNLSKPKMKSLITGVASRISHRSLMSDTNSPINVSSCTDIDKNAKFPHKIVHLCQRSDIVSHELSSENCETVSCSPEMSSVNSVNCCPFSSPLSLVRNKEERQNIRINYDGFVRNISTSCNSSECKGFSIGNVNISRPLLSNLIRTEQSTNNGLKLKRHNWNSTNCNTSTPVSTEKVNLSDIGNIPRNTIKKLVETDIKQNVLKDYVRTLVNKWEGHCPNNSNHSSSKSSQFKIKSKTKPNCDGKNEVTNKVSIWEKMFMEKQTQIK